MIIALFIAMMANMLTGEVIYSTTETFKLNQTECDVYVTYFWGDNGTPGNPKDDRFLGKEAVLNCGTASTTLVPEDLSTLTYVKPICYADKKAKLIRYDEYQANVAKKQAELSKMPATVIPQEQKVNMIKVKEIKQD